MITDKADHLCALLLLPDAAETREAGDSHERNRFI
jgi:hypothetical protein